MSRKKRASPAAFGDKTFGKRRPPPAPYSFHPTFPYPTSRNENARGIDRQHPTNDVHHKAKRRFAYCKEELASPKFLVQMYTETESRRTSLFSLVRRPSKQSTLFSLSPSLSPSLSLPLCLFVSHSESAGLTVDRVQPFNLAMRHQQASGYHGLLIAHVRLAEANGSFLRQSIKSSRRKNGREEKKEKKTQSRHRHTRHRIFPIHEIFADFIVIILGARSLLPLQFN